MNLNIIFDDDFHCDSMNASIRACDEISSNSLGSQSVKRRKKRKYTTG